MPLDLLKNEQDRIRDQLDEINRRLAATEDQHALIEANLTGTLDLVTDVQATYLSSPKAVRRQLNQALFSRIRILDDGDVQSDLAEPFKTLLSPQVKALAHSSDENPPEPDWHAWEASFNENTHEDDLVGAGKTLRPQGGRGLTYELLVAPGGVEPPHADSKLGE